MSASFVCEIVWRRVIAVRSLVGVFVHRIILVAADAFGLSTPVETIVMSSFVDVIVVVVFAVVLFVVFAFIDVAVVAVEVIHAVVQIVVLRLLLLLVSLGVMPVTSSLAAALMVVQIVWISI